MRHRPCSWRPRVGRRLSPACAGPFSCPSEIPRGWSAARRIHSTHALRRARPWRRTHALRRSIAAFLSPGPRFLVSVPVSAGLGATPFWAGGASAVRNRCNGPSPASSSRSGHSAARSGPEASRVRGYEPRPQAPHRRSRALPPVSSQGAAARSPAAAFPDGSIFGTSREDALGRARRVEYKAARASGDKFYFEISRRVSPPPQRG